MLAWWVGTAFDAAFVRQATLSLEEQLLPLAAALLALGSRIAGHPLHPPPLAGATAVVRLRRDVLDARDLEARGLQRPDRRLAARPRSLDEYLDLLQTVLDALARGRVSGHLRGERRRLARALEAGAAGGLPRDHVPLTIGQRDDREGSVIAWGVRRRRRLQGLAQVVRAQVTAERGRAQGHRRRSRYSSRDRGRAATQLQAAGLEVTASDVTPQAHNVAPASGGGCRGWPAIRDPRASSAAAASAVTCAANGVDLRRGPLKPAPPAEAPRDHVPLTIGQRDDRVVERRS